MDVTFDNQKRAQSNPAPVTRIYAPSHRPGTGIRAGEDSEDLPVRPQPKKKDWEAAAEAEEKRREEIPLSSKVLMLISVFIIAATAIFAISGSAQVAKIYTEIYSLEDEIKDYQEKISLIQKEQSNMTDYSTINEANQEAGRVIVWDEK